MPFPFLAAATALSAGAGLFGSIAGSRASAKAQRETNEANMQMAREQMAFQERMDSSKYQRGVEDARKAGFNPLVAFPGSAGSPMGASAVMQNPQPNKGELFLNAAKAIADTILTREMAETERSKQELNKAEADRVRDGEISNPMFGRMPVAAVKRNFANFVRGGFVQLASTAAQNAAAIKSVNNDSRIDRLENLRKGGR